MTAGEFVNNSSERLRDISVVVKKNVNENILHQLRTHFTTAEDFGHL